MAQVLPHCPPHVGPIGALHTIHQVTLQASTVAEESCRHVWQPQNNHVPLKQPHKTQTDTRFVGMDASCRNESMDNVQQAAIDQTQPGVQA